MRNFSETSLLFFSIAAVNLCLAGCRTFRPEIPGGSDIKIIGGTEIIEDDRPSVRRLEIKKKDAHGAYVLNRRCTMTFVRPSVALTAAHCICHGDRFVYREIERWQDFTAKRVEKHPAYKCGTWSPGPHDVALLWFPEDIAMPFSPVVGLAEGDDASRLELVGYGDDILKISGHFWLGTRKAESARSPRTRPSGQREFNGKRVAPVTTAGEPQKSPGFIRVAAEFEVSQTEGTVPQGDTGGAGEGDSGGPGFLPESGAVVGVMSRGVFVIQAIGSNRVKTVTELVDLRRDDIRQFLRNFEIIDE